VSNDAKNAKDKDPGDELIELLNELRVALPGVQVLFAFLLAVPFTPRFNQVTDLQKDAYFVTLLATMAGTVLLIAPSAYHRLRWRDAPVEELLEVSNTLAIVGTVFLALAMTAAVFLITDLLFKTTLTAIVTAGTAGAFAWLWYGLPLYRRARPPNLDRRAK
jgi:predicted membrane channel-forming protein YqfA (hemolysin III family)